MLNQQTIAELRTRLQKREITSQELTKACLRQKEKVDGTLRAFLHCDAEDALRQAREADRVLASGPPLASQPLLGIPVAIKDNIAVRGQPLTCASRILQSFVAPYDATVVEKLKTAGAVVFGRLNMDEFAMGSSTENSSVAATRNPWHADHVPGGSSGGCTAAVVSHQCIASLGSDTGGSIRQPASFCGCVGLKPTYGRVSRYGLVAFASSLDQIGPLTKDVRDAAVMLGVISGRDPRDSTSVPEAVPDYEAALTGDMKGIRLGLPKEYMIEGVDPQVKRAVEQAAEQCVRLGADLKEISLPHTDYSIAAYYLIATAEASANLARYDGVRYGFRVLGADPVEMYCRTRGAGFGTEVKRRILLGTYALSSGYYDAYYLRALKVRALIRQDFLRAFQEVDAVIGPTAPTAAFRAGEKTQDPLQMYLTDIFTNACNLAGICGISIPCGYTASPKLPIGLQLLGGPFQEATLLRLAHAYEQSSVWHKELPPLCTDP